MPEKIDDIDEVVERAELGELQPSSIQTLTDAATLMGLTRTASEEDIKDRFRDLATEFHPDSNPESTSDAFAALNRARDMMIAEPGEERAQRARQAAQDFEGAAETAGHGFGDWVDEQGEVREQLKQSIQLGFMEDFTGTNLDEYDTMDEALADGALEMRDVGRATARLRSEFGVEGLSLEDFANTVAALMMSGAVDMDFRSDSGSGGYYSRDTGGGGGFYSRSRSPGGRRR